MDIYLSSNSKGKIAEFKPILENTGHRIITPHEAGIFLSPDETGSCFKENAEIKAQDFFREIEGKVSFPYAVIADDSGLCVDCLGGEPGVRTSRYFGEGLTDRQKCLKLLEKLQDVPAEERGAEFQCVIFSIIVLKPSDSVCSAVTGTLRGEIGFEPRGDNGFGYDPVFYVSRRSLAELPSDEKNRLSHRFKALRCFAEDLNKLICR